MKELITLIFLFTISAATYAEGWNPSKEQKTKAEAVFRNFLTLVADEKYEQAYELQTEGMKRLMTVKKWSALEADFRKRSGGKPQFGNIRATWYKDPPNAEAPGIYAAFDYACRYKNINICSGIVILHSKDGEQFYVMRNEKTTMDQETEAKLRTNESAND